MKILNCINDIQPIRTREHYFSYHDKAIEKEGNELQIFCNNREDNLIEGLVHEIIEADIGRLLINITTKCYYNLDYFQIAHLCSVWSIPYYGCQIELKEYYEAIYKKYGKDKYGKLKRE